MLGSALDRALGIHDDAMILRNKRSTIISSNIANADTPNYRARDIDFKKAIYSALKDQNSQMAPMSGSQNGHLKMSSGNVEGMDNRLLYRIPIQSSLDGNSVDSHVEYTKFTENSMRYEASMKFLGGKFRSLRLAIKGE